MKLFFIGIFTTLISIVHAEKRASSPPSRELKSEDFLGATADSPQTRDEAETTPSLTKEQTQFLQQKLQEIKKQQKQEEATLLELEKGM